MDSWWIGHKFPSIPLDVLPKKVFIYNNGVDDTYCCTMYETDSLLAWVAWQISNPNIESNKDELNDIFKVMTLYAKNLGYKLLFTTSKHTTVINSLLDNEFALGDDKVDHYFKTI